MSNPVERLIDAIARMEDSDEIMMRIREFERAMAEKQRETDSLVAWSYARPGWEAAILRRPLVSLLGEAKNGPGEPQTTYVTKVPDHHDRITWRDKYYHLPLNEEPQTAPVVPVESKQAERADAGESMEDPDFPHDDQPAPVDAPESINDYVDWIPTSKNINALPEPIRKFIHDIKTLCDPADMVQEIAALKDQRVELVATVQSLRAGHEREVHRAAIMYHERCDRLQAERDEMTRRFKALCNGLEIEAFDRLATQSVEHNASLGREITKLWKGIQTERDHLQRELQQALGQVRRLNEENAELTLMRADKQTAFANARNGALEEAVRICSNIRGSMKNVDAWSAANSCVRFIMSIMVPSEKDNI